MDEPCKVQHIRIAVEARNVAAVLRNGFGFEAIAKKLDAFAYWHMNADNDHESGITHGPAPKEEEL